MSRALQLGGLRLTALPKWSNGKINDDTKRRWKQELSDVKAEDLGRTFHSLAEVEAEVVRRMIRDGFSSREIAEETEHSKSTVQRYRTALLKKGGKIRGAETPYERKDIPYEKETEVTMLLWRWGVYSLDEEAGECERQRHEAFASASPAPDEELMSREHQQERDDYFKWIRSWVSGLPGRASDCAQRLMYCDDVTDDDMMFLRHEVARIFCL